MGDLGESRSKIQEAGAPGEEPLRPDDAVKYIVSHFFPMDVDPRLVMPCAHLGVISDSTAHFYKIEEWVLRLRALHK